MKIKAGNEKEWILFSDFRRHPGEDEPLFIDVLVEITTHFAVARERITIELSDLEGFAQNLRRLDETLQHLFYFRHIDGQLEIKFEPQITGNILINGLLQDKLFLNALSFSFEMPPTAISGLLKECEEVKEDV